MPEDTSAQPRSFWSGSIAFGLVSVPVSLFVAQRSSHVSLRMVDEDGTPLRRRYFCNADDRPLDRDEIVRGFEVEKDRFVVVADEELEALAPEKSREIDLRRFVERSQIDPVYFERAYFLAPDRGAVKAYRLLARSMEEAGRAGIATFVMRGKEYLVAIIAERGVLRAETLRFSDELRSPEDVGLPGLEQAKAERVRAVEQSMRDLAAERLDRDALRDLQARRLRELAERKLASGADVVAATEVAEGGEGEEEAEVIDLMQVLKRSLEAAPEAAGRRRRPRRGPRRAPARAAGDAELEQQSKSELYERAKALDIEGRGSMNKAQLIAAIRRAS